MDAPSRLRNGDRVRRLALAALATSLALLGCPQDVRPLGDAGLDGGAPVDAASPDGGAGVDAGRADASEVDGGRPDAAEADAGRRDAGAEDGGLVPNPPCEPEILPCLDPAPEDVYSVPDEIGWAAALEAVRANQTIQIRGLEVPGGVRVPPAVTLHGCEGARITGAIVFQGIGGRVQGFEVSGSVVANQTGAYVVRRNRFVGDAFEAGVSARSVDALVSASVAMIVEQNRFVGRRLGVHAATRYDTMQHEVTIEVRDNVFDGCLTGVSLSEAGLVGRIEAELVHNTFHDFDDAIRIDLVDRVTPLSANLFARGQRAVAGESLFELRVAMLDDVATESQTRPFSGTFVRGDADFVDAEAGDFRLSPTSDAIDFVPNAEAGLDFAGCPRPVAFVDASPTGDVGALEAQP